MDHVQRLQLLDWKWIFPPLEKDVGALSVVDRDALLQELHRFIAVKVAKDDLDGTNEFASTGLVDKALHSLLLNPFFCANLMRMLDKSGKVLSHVPADRDDHEDRVRKYLQYYAELFKCIAPATLPSGAVLWPAHLLRKRAADHTSAENASPARRARTNKHTNILVKTVTGRTVSFSVADFNQATLQDLATFVQEVTGVAIHAQRLVFRGTQLPVNEQLLIHFGVSDQSVVHQVLNIRGC